MRMRTKIVWLRDHETLARMTYVREKIQLCSIRTCPVKAPQGEMLIGYAVLKKTAAKADHAGFRRRIFTCFPKIWIQIAILLLWGPPWKLYLCLCLSPYHRRPSIRSRFRRESPAGD